MQKELIIINQIKEYLYSGYNSININISIDLYLSKLLRYVGIKNFAKRKVSELTSIFIEKDMWHSCKYMITHSEYNFNNIYYTSNDSKRKYYLLMTLITNIKPAPSLYNLFLINDEYLCCELLKLYLPKYSIERILYLCSLYKSYPYYNNLMPVITEYLNMVKFMSSLRGLWINACILR